jgi:Glycosyltransferase family 87
LHLNTTPPRRRLFLYGLIAGLAIFTSLLLTRNIDFRVYWYAVRALTDGSRPLYGPSSGIGFPMYYRYPPVTYILLWPLGQTSLAWAGFIWTLGAWAAAIAAVILAIRTTQLRFSRNAIIAACAYMLAYVVLAVRYGNIQPYLIAMILAALVLSETHPVLSATLLALAITFKIWPLFFVPWFLRRNRRMALAWLIPAMLLLWLVPLFVWSPARYLDLIGQWFHSEVQSAGVNSEMWYFPGQSLRGILLRYLTVSEPWAKGFPDVHMFSFPAAVVVRAWEAIAAAIYAATSIAMLRSDDNKRWIWDGASFALFTLLEPFGPISGMISIGPAVLVAAAASSAESRGSLARRLFLGACVLSFLGAILQYRPLLRLLLVVGLDFYAALLLFTALVLAGNEAGPAGSAKSNRVSLPGLRTTSMPNGQVRKVPAPEIEDLADFFINIGPPRRERCFLPGQQL